MSEVNTTYDASALEFDNKMHRLGRIFMILALITFLAVPAVIALLFQAGFRMDGILGSLTTILMVYLPSCIVEVLIYAPMLGTGATYLAFVTGNLSNLKIPCAVNAREIAGTKYGTKENEIISTLSVGSSSIVTTLVIAIGVLAITPFRPVLESEVLAPAFANVVPALFGAMGLKFFAKDPKLAIAPMAVMLGLCFLLPITAEGKLPLDIGFLIPIGGAVSIAVAWLLYKKKWIQ